MVKTVIFDWHGTLHNTKVLYGAAFRKGCAWLCENGYGGRCDYTDEEASEYIGFSAVEMWRLFRPDLPEEVTAVSSEIVAQAMVKDISAGKAILYPGALDVLSELKIDGYKLAFLSNCRISYMEAHKNYFDLEKYFDRMYNCEAFNWKSKVEIFKTLKKELPGEYIMVGDRLSDLEVAYTHGFKSIGCSYGFSFEGELDKADRIADDVRQIPLLVRELT